MKKTFGFDFKAGEFKFKGKNPLILSGRDALELWIEKCLRTQLNRYSIYRGTRYGANIEDLVIGKSYGKSFVESELRREIEDALLRNEDIQALDDFSVTAQGDLMQVSFTLTTTYGDLLSYMTTEEEESIMEDVLALPPKYRVIIYMHYYQGYKAAEIGQMLNMKESTVLSRLSRGRMKLREILTQGGISYAQS